MGEHTDGRGWAQLLVLRFSSVLAMPPRPIDRTSALHRQWGDDCDAWELLALDDLLVVEERMPPGSTERRHHHARARQFFYVLTGTLTIEQDGHEHAVPAGSGLHVAPGTSHVVMNRTPAEATFLAIAAPTTTTDRHDG
jgi:uncharacterized cupin superfamily protein